MEKLEKIFDLKKENSKESIDLSGQLCKMLEDRFGFNYSQTDHYELIDSLDYGTSDISYVEFIKTMNYYKNEMESGNWNPKH